MKRIWFAIVFLAIAAAMCVGEQCFIRTFHAEVNSAVTAAETAAERGDDAALKAALNELKRCWNKSNNLLCMFTNHAVPDELGARIRGIRSDCDDLLLELDNIRAFNDVLYENQRITPANVF